MQTGILFPNLSPLVFPDGLWGYGIPLRWYALAYIIGIVIGWRISVAALNRPRLWGGTAPMTPPQLENLLTWIIVGIIAGGRLGYVLFYNPAYYLANPLEIPILWSVAAPIHGAWSSRFRDDLRLNYRAAARCRAQRRSRKTQDRSKG